MIEFLREPVKFHSMSQPVNRSLAIPSVILTDQINDAPPHVLTLAATEPVLRRIKEKSWLFAVQDMPILLETLSHAALDFDPQLRGHLDDRIGLFQLFEIRVFRFHFVIPSYRQSRRAMLNEQ